MRISLKDALVIVAFCAGIAWCAAQVGFDNGMFWFVVAQLAVMSGLFVGLSSSARLPVLFLFILLSLVLASVTLLTGATILLVAGIVFAVRPVSNVRALTLVALIAAMVGLAVGMLPGIAMQRELEATRQEYPIVSLASRLTYESRLDASAKMGASVIPVSISQPLIVVENNLSTGNYREFHFRRLHAREYERFVRAIGFGVGRMIPFRPESFRRPATREIQFDDAVAEKPKDDYDDWQAFWRTGKSDDIEHLHAVSRGADFFDPDSFGAVLERITKVVGFVPHAFHYPPAASLENARAWIIERLELVSLLKFDGPRVYVLDHLPRMDQLSGADVPTRALDDFESESLAKLRTEEDVVTTHDGAHYRMLGSLRAAKQCLDCHSVDRGELLGAFSYKLELGMGSAGN